MTSPDEQPAPPRRLTRSSTDRIIGGVAGGLGRHLGVDPIIVRVGFVLLCFLGGAGVVAYLALLAFVPSDGEEPVQSSRALTVVGTVGLAVAAVVFLGTPAIVLGPGLLVLALIALVVVVIVRAAGGTGDPARTAARIGLLSLAVLAGCGGAIGVAALAALDGGVVVGILTVVTGLVLVATAFLGGARWLIAPALVLALPLAIVTAADLDIKGGIGQREFSPSSLSDLRPGYRVGIGGLDLDLRGIELPAGRTDVTIDVGLGVARISVPTGVCVTSDVTVGAGAADVFDHVNDGIDVAFADGGAPSPGQPRLHVDANIGAGQLDITRGDFDAGFQPDGLEAACP
jgi:phage shock protein PspC (stress-responsive transcriptional regulator)